jgi:hypothetical protein
MAAVNPGVWGIDIGQCALKALRLEQINGVVTATAFDHRWASFNASASLCRRPR